MSVLKRRIPNVNTFQTWSPQWQEIFVNQYDQGKVKLQQHGSGDGLDLLESPTLPLMSPMLATMRCALIYDPKSPRAGGFQLRIEENSQPVTQFTVPFINIEHIFLLPNLIQKEEQTFVIIPKGHSNASTVERYLLQPIVFGLCDESVIQGLGAEKKQATLLGAFFDAFERVCNNALMDINGVISKPDRRHDLTASVMLTSLSARCLMEESRPMEVCRIHLLNEGIFVAFSNSCHFFSLKWVEKAYLVVDRDLMATGQVHRGDPRKAPAVNLNVLLSIHYDDRQEREMIMNFSGLEPTRENLDKLLAYWELHNIRNQKLQQLWYDYQDDQPSTGWEPLSDVQD